MLAKSPAVTFLISATENMRSNMRSSPLGSTIAWSFSATYSVGKSLTLIFVGFTEDVDAPLDRIGSQLRTLWLRWKLEDQEGSSTFSLVENCHEHAAFRKDLANNTRFRISGDISQGSRRSFLVNL